MRIARTAAVALLLLTACADAGGAAREAPEPSPPAPSPPTPDDLLLRVEQTGGFGTPAMLASRLPLVSVYADGRMITQGPQILSYPPPALPNLQVRRLSRADAQAMVERARAAGIGGPPVDYGHPTVADEPSIRVTVGDDVVEVYALGEEGGLSADQLRARRRLRELVSALTDVAPSGSDARYEPAAVAAVATPWRLGEGDEGLPEPPEVAWPGPDLPGESIGPETGCVVAAEPRAVRDILAKAAKATSLTPWRSAGKRWTVALRPLLPDESGCADLRD